MRLHYLISDLIFINAISNYGADASVPSSKALVHDASDLEFRRNTQDSAPERRLVRGTRAVISDSEERVKPSIFEKVERITSTPFIPREREFQEYLNVKEAESDIYRRMGLVNLKRRELFDHPAFQRWIVYVKDLNHKYPEEGAYVIPVLTDHLGDVEVYKMLDKATTSSNSALATLAHNLKAEQAAFWIAEKQKHPKEVLFILGVKIDNLFTSPKFWEWKKYVDDFNKYHHEDQELITTLKQLFEVNDLFKQIVKAKNANSLSADEIKVVNTLEDKLMLSLGGKELREALASLQLLKTENGLSSSPLVDFRLKLMDAYMIKFPDEKVKLLTTLSRRFGHKTVALTILAGKSNPETRTIAEKLESLQREMWFKRGFSADRVYERLGLSESENDFSRSQLSETWISYVDYYYEKKSKSIDEFFTMLKKKFSDKPLNQILEVAKQFPSMKAEATKVQFDSAFTGKEHLRW